MNNDLKLTLPNNASKLLLHCCCAPCAAAIIELLQINKINFTIFFYNPNIYPKSEYELRKAEIICFANKYNIAIVDADYNYDDWRLATNELSLEPERGKRCTVCFQFRLEQTALYCINHNFQAFATSLTISRHKNSAIINNCGLAIAANYPGLSYWEQNWRTICPPQLMQAISKRENFYRQKYCGCIYSIPKKNNTTV